MGKDDDWYGEQPYQGDLAHSYYRVPGKKMMVVPKYPNDKDLFGRELSLDAKRLLSHKPDYNFRFKRNAYDDGYRLLDEGYPYDYSSDNQYSEIVHGFKSSGWSNRIRNVEYLHQIRKARMMLLPEFLTNSSFFRRGPSMAIEPNESDTIGYIWPSYIIWENDPSHVLFDGSPEFMEFPKHVLRETTGHNHQDRITPQYRIPRFQTKWSR